MPFGPAARRVRARAESEPASPRTAASTSLSAEASSLAGPALAVRLSSAASSPKLPSHEEVPTEDVTRRTTGEGCDGLP
jgi:hypothetical protein